VAEAPSPPSTSPAFRFSHGLRVRWAEVDGQNVVFNGHYLTYFDVAATEYWRALGYSYASFLERGVDTFAVKATLEYEGPARFDDDLDVGVRVARLGRSSMTVAFEIRRRGDRLVKGELIYVFVDPTARRPVPIPEEIQQSVTAYEITPPERP
jgi:acyl-CoA thioester hydrolase